MAATSRRQARAPSVRPEPGSPNDAKPEPAAEWVPIDAVHPWAKNPRKNDKVVPKLVKSIKRFGFGAPILARKADGEIIAGHTRYKAALKLGLRQIPVRFLDLDPTEAHVLALADNRIGEEADWDQEQQRDVLSELREDGIDLLDGTGFSDKDIAKLLDPDGLGGEDGAGDESDELGERFQVIVDCDDERAQAMLIEKLQSEGFKVKAMIG
jgi:ParB family chromosome partitioning protein